MDASSRLIPGAFSSDLSSLQHIEDANERERRTRRRLRTNLKAPRNQPGERIRTVVGALVDLVPGGGLASAHVDDFVPKGAENARQDWEDVITNRTNEHSQALSDNQDLIDPKETIEGVAVELVVALANACTDGLCEQRYDPESRAIQRPDA